jgi:signal transduction histidine kinase
VKRRLLLTFILIIFMPITVMTVMAVSSYKGTKQQIITEHQEEAAAVLLSNARLLQNRLNQIEAELNETLLDPSLPHRELRNEMNRKRLVRQAFIIDSSNTFLYPLKEGEISERENNFIIEAESMELASSLRSRSSHSEDKSIESHWYTWFMGDGINFISYRIEDNTIKGFLIERYALISQLINVLPVSQGKDESFKIQLTDARGDILYQWGDYTIDDSIEPLQEYSLKEPLASWRLFYFYNTEIKSENDLSAFSMIPVTALFTILILILAIYFYRENTREMKIARNQVSFVNQVSHELKTPLTNIRLYSELLQNLLTEPKEQAYLDVIVQEGSRLGRMINNVLTFSRGERGELKKNIEKIDVNNLIIEVLNKFIPLLKEHSILYEFEKIELPLIETDRDMVEQILVNIIGNSIKYGSAGKYLGIKTEVDEKNCIIFISDKGPGIADSEKSNIFQPFYRIDNSLSQNSSGSGIGLSIARTLAVESGSILKLEKSTTGACFSLTIPIKEVNN